jgi:hypothetical protein
MTFHRAAAVIHMVPRHHNSGRKKLFAEDQVMDALRRVTILPGEYITAGTFGRRWPK